MLHIKRKNKDFTYCLDTYVIRDKNCISKCCTNGNLPDKIKIVWKAGYEAVELWHPDIENYIQFGGSIDKVKNLLLDCNLSLPSYKVISNWLEVPENEFNRNFENHKRVIEIASRIGAKSIILKMINESYRGQPPSIELCIERYTKYLKFCENLNIKPALEFMSIAHYWNQLENILEIMNKLSHPLACQVLDTFHIWRSGDKDFIKFENAIKKYGINPNQISVIHFTDAAKDIPQHQQTDMHRRLPGVGLLNLRKFINILRNIGYQGALSLNVYDRGLWNIPPLKVAIDGYYRMAKEIENLTHLVDDTNWKDKQNIRCLGLWATGNKHLDPRLENNNRQAKLKNILDKILEGKNVLDFKCGFSPLAQYVTTGFDAFEGCIDYLKKTYPNKTWLCCSDEDFAGSFNDKIDVLLHLGIGDSDTEIESHLKIRENCNPKIIIIECCANKYGKVDNTKLGSSARWERLKKDLKGKETFFKTNMSDRSDRLLFVGEKIGN